MAASPISFLIGWNFRNLLLTNHMCDGIVIW